MRRISVCFLSIARKHSPFQNYCVSKPIIQIPYVLGDFEMSLTTEGTYLRFRQLHSELKKLQDKNDDDKKKQLLLAV